MKSYVTGFLVAGSGAIIALVLWIVGYIVLPNADTHRHLAQNPKIQTSAVNDTSTSASPGASSTGGTGTPGTSTSTPSAASTWYSLDASSKTVNFAITAGDQSVESGMNFNGYSNGQMVITVPLNWKVDIAFKNVDSNMPHSIGVVPWKDHLNFQAPAAFNGSEQPNFNAGITASNGTIHVKFIASKSGRFGLICGIPGHAAAGMWDEFDVSSAAKSPTVKTPSGTVTVS